MDRVNSLSSFLSEDFAYFLGLVVGRGTLIRGTETNRIVIDFPYKNIQTGLDGDEHNVHLSLSNSLDKIVSRIRRLGMNPNKINDEENKKVSIVIPLAAEDTAWRLVAFLLNHDYTSYHDFRVPRSIFEADAEKRKEFLRGIFDVTGHVRPSNLDQSGQHRVYIELNAKNWFITADLYELCQGFGVPVSNVNFGHPNFRDPKATGSSSWSKEHQFKIYANQFVPIGSYINHKEKVLQQLAAQNRPGVGVPTGRVRVTHKASHPEELSAKLPVTLQGKHFDHYMELLSYLQSVDPERSWKTHAHEQPKA